MVAKMERTNGMGYSSSQPLLRAKTIQRDAPPSHSNHMDSMHPKGFRLRRQRRSEVFMFENLETF